MGGQTGAGSNHRGDIGRPESDEEELSDGGGDDDMEEEDSFVVRDEDFNPADHIADFSDELSGEDPVVVIMDNNGTGAASPLDQ